MTSVIHCVLLLNVFIVLANNAVAIFMINVFGGKSGSSYIDLTASNELKVKTQLGKTEDCDAIQEELSIWLMKSGDENYFGHEMVLKKGDEKCFSNAMYVLDHTSGT
jgi:hypothetical protein